jgi:choline kinase
MKALILAAGRGSRMGERTDDRPKCLVEVGGRSLLSRQVGALRGGGADEIGIVRGYRAQSIAVDGATYFENDRWSSTNMVMSLATARSWLSAAPTIVSYSDIFYGRELVAQLAAAPGDLVVAYDLDWLALWQRRFADPLSDAETFRTDEQGRLVEIGARAKSLDEIGGQYMGLLKFTPAAWQAVERALAKLEPTARDKLDMTSLLRLLLIADFPISTLPTRGQWGEVDNPSDIAVYEAMAATGQLELA